jgi:hypothetical protein
LEQHVCEIRIRKLEVSLVVEFEQGRTVGVFLFQVKVVDFGLAGRVSALLAHVHFGPPLLVGVLVLDAVHFETVRLQRASLREAFFTKAALVRPHSCKNRCRRRVRPKDQDSPVCVLVCLFRSKVSLKPFPQKVHKYLLTSEWHFMCLLRRRCKAKVLLQMRQQKLVWPSSVVMDATLALSSVRGPCRTVSWLARGFLMPWPPFTNSSCTSEGRPNCNSNRTWNERLGCRDSIRIELGIAGSNRQI